jgi:predicted O-methyltransferase YrrM
VVSRVATAPIDLVATGAGKAIEAATGSKTIGKYVEAGVKLGAGAALMATGVV